MISQITNYEPTARGLWQGRQDSLPGERFFQNVKCEDIRSSCLGNSSEQKVIIGFRSDEGVIRNEGRPGAKEGPNNIRQQLAKLACQRAQSLLDLGNISCEDNNLEKAQEQLALAVSHCHSNNKTTIILGGGHETAWGHYQGLAPHYPKLGIINFDAHFDIRHPTYNKQGTSGTPFYQIHDYCKKNNESFNYCCIGIQETANTKSLFDKADEWAVTVLTSEQVNQESFAWQSAFLDDFIFQNDAIYLSICMDVFAECFAPGVSAPQPMGLTPWQVLPLLKYVAQTGRVVSLDIVELSPPLDYSDKTSRLAAKLLAELLNLS